VKRRRHSLLSAVIRYETKANGGGREAKKDVKNEVQSQFLLKTNKIALVQSHFLGSKPFLGGSSAALSY